MSGTVYIVHCVDTEGPLFESLEATFNRVESLFDISIEPSAENLIKLQKGEIDLDGREKQVQKVVAPKQIETNETWDEIFEQLDEITDPEFRHQYSDSTGNGWRFNWFVLDHVGFTGTNPRRRSLGHHSIYDQYRRYIKRNSIQRDQIYWHYHPLSMRKDAHRGGTPYLDSDNIHTILARKILDRAWFPAAFRPGFHTERPDSHWFLEQWIPFDFGNQSGKSSDDAPDASRGRFGNWTRAPTEWSPYNPAHDDYQSRGNCRRYITRCLNMDTRLRNLTKSDVRDAFVQAKESGNALLAFVDHDFRDMARHIEKIWGMIFEVSSEFETVTFEHTTAVDGMRNILEMETVRQPGLEIERKTIDETPLISVTAANEIFGPQPFLALKTKSGEYHWDNFDRPTENSWYYHFDFHTLPLDAIETIGVAANSPAGVTEVLSYNPDTEEKTRQVWNDSSG